MGTFAGHVAPGVLLFVYGLLLHLHSVHTHFLLSHPYRRVFLHSPAASKLLTSYTPPSSSRPSRLLLNASLRRIAYASAIVLAAVLIPVEISHWNGSWQAMASPQHATMYGMVLLSATIGLCMDGGLLPETARVAVGPCFWLCGLMFAGHAQHGEYNTAIHVILAYLFYAAGISYLLYAAALSSCRAAAAYFLPLSSSPSSSPSSKPPSSSYSIVLAVLTSLLSLLSRLTSLSVVLCGTWMLHIAFKLFSPFTLPAFLTSPPTSSTHSMDAADHSTPSTPTSPASSLDAETHTLFLTLAWHYLAVVSVALVVEVCLRRSLGEWSGGEANGARHREYERVEKVYQDEAEDEVSEAGDGWKTANAQTG